MSSPAPELTDELEAFRREWLVEARQRKQQQPAASTSSTSTSHHQLPPRQQSPPTSPKQGRKSLDAEEDLRDRLAGVQLEETREKERPKSALDLYTFAVASEREGRLQDALVNYRSAFRLDPDVDKAYNRASLAAQKHAASRGAEPTAPTTAKPGEFRFERTLQLGPDYDPRQEHRTKEVAERDSGSGDIDSTHPSSTAFLLNSLLRSIAENPFERPPPAVSTAVPTSPSKASAPLPPVPTSSSSPKNSSTPTLSAAEVLATLSFIPADEERPLPLAILPHEVLLLILQHLLLSSILPPARTAHPEPEHLPPHAGGKGKRVKKRSLREEMEALELELELEDADREWKSDVEAFERFARTCRMARVLTLDAGLWRRLCLRTYVPPQQISREEDANKLVRAHGNGDWRRMYIEHPRIRLDGAYISVVTYLRRGEEQAWTSPTHLITFYRYLRFYHHGLVISLLTTDPPNTIVRRLNPSMRMKGLTFGRWRLRDELVELWGLEDPSVPEASRKYSFRMNCRLKSTTRGRMNKLEMLSLATENRTSLEIEEVPIRPSKPFFFSRVNYVGEDRPEPPA